MIEASRKNKTTPPRGVLVNRAEVLRGFGLVP